MGEEVLLLFLRKGVDFACEQLGFLMLSFIIEEASCKDTVFNHVRISVEGESSCVSL